MKQGGSSFPTHLLYCFLNKFITKQKNLFMKEMLKELSFVNICLNCIM